MRKKRCKNNQNQGFTGKIRVKLPHNKSLVGKIKARPLKEASLIQYSVFVGINED